MFSGHNQYKIHIFAVSFNSLNKASHGKLYQTQPLAWLARLFNCNAGLFSDT